MRKIIRTSFILSLFIILLGGCTKNRDHGKTKVSDHQAVPLNIEQESAPEHNDEELMQSTDNNNDFENNIRDIIKNYNMSGELSVYVRDIKNEESYLANPNKMQAASLIKLYIAGCVYENYDEVSSFFGNDARVEELVKTMITISDNGAANSLILALGNNNKFAGMDKVNVYCEKHEYNSTHMGRLLLQSNIEDDNYTSVEDCGKILLELYTEKIEGAENILKYMKLQERVSKIPAGIPAGVVVANKTGELLDVENDVAIVFEENSPYILCIMTQNLKDASLARSLETQLSSEIYLYMSGE